MQCLHWVGSVPKFANYLRTWGEASTVTTKTNNTPKPKDRGVHCMFVGYAEGHVGDCYQMWNPITNKVYESRDVVFLQRMFYVKSDGPFSATVRMIPEIEGVEKTDSNEDDLDEEEMVEEAEIKERGVENGTTEINVGTESEESLPEIDTVDTPTNT